MHRHVIKLAITLAFCLSVSSCSEEPQSMLTSDSRRVTLTDAEAVAFTDNLARAGIQPHMTGLSGSLLTITLINCRNHHTTRGPVECVAQTIRGTVSLVGPEAANLFAILSAAHGGAPHDVTARDITCVANRLDPQKSASCTFSL